MRRVEASKTLRSISLFLSFSFVLCLLTLTHYFPLTITRTHPLFILSVSISVIQSLHAAQAAVARAKGVEAKEKEAAAIPPILVTIAALHDQVGQGQAFRQPRSRALHNTAYQARNPVLCALNDHDCYLLIRAMGLVSCSALSNSFCLLWMLPHTADGQTRFSGVTVPGGPHGLQRSARLQP